MERWNGKIAAVTGASSGIGAAIVIDLAKAGMKVVGLARRKERVEELKKDLGEIKGEIHAYECDVTNVESVKAAFEWIEKTFGGINVLVNNAGMTYNISILKDEDSLEIMQKVINTNITGLVSCTKQAYNILQKTNDIGHIINIGSIVGHKVPFLPARLPTYNVYPGTKHAVKAITETLRNELLHLSENVRISCVSPGFVRTEILQAANFDDYKERFDSSPVLIPEDISSAVVYILGTPARVEIQDLIIKPRGELM